MSKFPCYQSHYSRQDNPNRKYLSPDLSISKMYALYKEEQGEQAVSEWKYRQVFNSSFNLTFGRYIGADYCVQYCLYTVVVCVQ